MDNKSTKFRVTIKLKGILIRTVVYENITVYGIADQSRYLWLLDTEKTRVVFPMENVLYYKAEEIGYAE